MITHKLETDIKILTTLWLVKSKYDIWLTGRAFWLKYDEEYITCFHPHLNRKFGCIVITYTDEEWCRENCEYVLDDNGDEIKCWATSHDEVLHWLNVFKVATF